MRLLKRLIVAVVVLFILAGFALWTCPADLAYRVFADRFGPVVLGDLSGTLWHGHAGSLRVFGRELGGLDWLLAPMPLLHGDTVVHIDLHGSDNTARATLTRHADKELEIVDATVELPATVLDPAIGVPDLRMQGRIEIHLTQLRLRGAWLESAEGDAVWHDAAVAGATVARLSDLRATFATIDGGISGELRDLGGPLAADGIFRAAGGDYDAELKLAARDDDARVQDALQHVGQPQADGSVLLKIRGHLLKLF